MSVVVQRLNEKSRGALLSHFVALPLEDRRLRFGSPVDSDSIARYVDRIQFDDDAVFAVYDDKLALIGVAHVAFGDDMAELGLSVLPGCRRSGIGNSLFERGSEHARNRHIPKLYMHCLAENASVMRMARRFGMHVVVSTGDADAHLELPPASPASIGGEFMNDRIARYDHALKVQTASWKRINDAMLDMAVATG